MTNVYTLSSQNKRFALGLTWSRKTSAKPKADLVAIADQEQSPFGLFIQNKADTSFGVTDQAEFNRTIAGAGVLCQYANHLIFIETLGESLFWVVAIFDGAVLPGGDTIVNQDALIRKISEYGSLFQVGESAEPLIIASSSLTLDDLSEAFTDIVAINDADDTDLTRYLERDFDGLLADFLNDYKPHEQNAIFQQNTIHAIGRGKSLPIIPITIGAGALLGLVVLAFWTMGDDPPPVVNLPPVRTAKPVGNPVALNTAQSLKQQQAQILKNARLEEIQWLLDDLNFSAPAQLVQSAVDFYTAIPHFANGWALTKVNFDLVDDQLTTEWSATGGTLSQFLRGFDPKEKTVVALDGRHATHFHTFQPLPRQLTSDDLLPFIQDTALTRTVLMDRLRQQFKKNWSLKVPKDERRREPIKGLRIASKIHERQLSDVGMLLLTIKGAGVYQLRLLHDLLQSNNAIASRQIVITNDNNQWEYHGVYYETTTD